MLRQIRAQDLDLPVIVASARGGEDDEHAARELGVTEYLVKPFPIGTFLGIVARL